MVREIGSEFWTEENRGTGVRSLMPENWETYYALCGRAALDRIVEDILCERPAASVYMPSYCCHTMIEPFLKHGVEVRFYDVIPSDDGLQCGFQENSCDIVFLIDYFGFLSPETRAFALRERQMGKTIVYDRSHSLFCRGDFFFADYQLGSFRKWFAVNAGFAAKAGSWKAQAGTRRADRYCEMRNRAFDLKAAYIHGDDSVEKAVFLSLFGEAEEMLEADYAGCVPDERSLRVLETVDTEQIREKRRRNAECLITGLQGVRGVRLPYRAEAPEECPLFVPVCLDDRDGLRRSLIGRQIYCPAHWPVSDMHRLDSRTRALYDTEMSVVCDQRYEPEDMERIVRCIREYAGA